MQAIKAGLLEVGDVVVVNKTDLPGASDALRFLRSAFSHGHAADGRLVPVLAANAVDGTGMQSLLAAIEDHGAWLDSSGCRAIRREQRVRTEILAGLRSALDTQLQNQPHGTGAMQNAVAQVVRKEQSPRQAVAAIVGGLLGS